MADVAPRVTPLVVPGRGVDRHVPSYRGLRVTMGGFGFPLVALQGRVRARSVMVGVAVVAMLFPLVGVAPAAQAAAATTVVSLTFDDTNADQMGAATTMQASGLHGTFYAISGSIGTPNYLTLANLQTVYGAGNEIGGHTVNHPDLTLESADEAQRQICDARNQLTAWGFPQTSFAYPYAVVNASVETIVKNCGYNSARSLGDVQTQLGGTAGLYAETVPPPDAFALRAPDEVDSTWTLTALQNTVTNAETHGGGWDILTFHHVCEPGTTNCDPTVSITPELFTQFTTWLAAHLQSTPTTTVKTVNQVIGGSVKPAVTAPAPPAVAGALTNASLETAVTPGVPNCWSAYAYGTNTPAYTETSPGHTGNVAETITMTGYTNGDAKLMPTFDTGGCSPAATAGHSYQLGAWYKSTGVTQFEVYYRTATGAFVYWTSSPYFAAATAWTQALWTTPALPAGATGISFGLNILGNGTLTTDDYTDVDVTPAPGAVMSLPPARIMDTRTNLGVTGPVPSLGTVSLQVTGQGGVPASGVSAVVVNVTAADPTSAGYITVWPSGTTMQQTSNLNFQAGQNIPNLVVVPVGADGKIQLFNGSGGTVQLLADVTGYILGGTPTLPGAVASLSPARIMDTRSNLGVNGPVPSMGTASLQVTGKGGVPATGVSAVVVNVTAVNPTSAGYITVWPSGTTMQQTSNLNFQAGQNIPNLVVVPVGADGKIQLFNGSGGTVQLIADVTGYILGGTPTLPGAVASLSPARIMDTRTNLGVTGPVPALGTASLQVTGKGGVPATGVSAVVVNITAVNATSSGFITVWPSGTAQQQTSNLNFQAGQNIPNLVVVPVGADGKIQLFNGSGGTVQLLADVTGYILGGVPTAPGAVATLSPSRIMDTRSNLGVNGPVPSMGTASLQVTGKGGVPATGVSAVVVNITAVNPTSSGFITVWPSGTAQQQTSNLNFQAGQNIPNLVVVPVGADGKIQLFN